MSEQTHYDGCYREHHGCAVAEIDRLTRENSELRHDIERATDNHAADLRELAELRAARNLVIQCYYDGIRIFCREGHDRDRWGRYVTRKEKR